MIIGCLFFNPNNFIYLSLLHWLCNTAFVILRNCYLPLVTCSLAWFHQRFGKFICLLQKSIFHFLCPLLHMTIFYFINLALTLINFFLLLLCIYFDILFEINSWPINFTFFFLIHLLKV